MKLWIKIFLSILLVSITALLVSTNFVIYKSHIANVDREKERTLNEYDFIRSSLKTNLDFKSLSDESLQAILKRYDSYYTKKNIKLVFYQNETYIYNSFPEIGIKNYTSFLSVKDKQKIVQIKKINGRYYIIEAGKLPDTSIILLYIRDISTIYAARNQSMVLSLLLSGILTCILGVFSYFYSKWITRPVEALHKGAKTISSGDYNVCIPEYKDEFNDVIKTFNTMALAVKTHTRELEDTARERQEFIDDLSHEMNTPLTSIQGYSEFLLSANASEEQRNKALINIRNEAKRMNEIYQKLMLLTLTRGGELELANVATQDLLGEIKNTFDLQLKEKQISFQTESTVNTLSVDRTLFHMLLSNLVKNSIQALPEGGYLKISVTNEGQKPMVQVTDNGEGIPEDNLRDVVKPFFRVDKSRSRKTGGAGLGLSLCKSIAEQHHAALTIDSRTGKGTTVTIKFL